MAYWIGKNAGGVVASLVRYPKRKRIRDRFISDLRTLRPDVELTESDDQRLLIRTRATITRFELAGLYNAVMRAKSNTNETEIRARFLRGLVSVVDSSVPQKVATEAGGMDW